MAAVPKGGWSKNPDMFELFNSGSWSWSYALYGRAQTQRSRRLGNTIPCHPAEKWFSSFMCILNWGVLGLGTSRTCCECPCVQGFATISFERHSKCVCPRPRYGKLVASLNPTFIHTPALHVWWYAWRAIPRHPPSSRSRAVRRRLLLTSPGIVTSSSRTARPSLVLPHD